MPDKNAPSYQTFLSAALFSAGINQDIPRKGAAAMATLPSISAVTSLGAEPRAQILDTLFEPCPQLHTLSVSLLREREFSSYDELIAAVGQQLTGLYESRLESDTKWLDAILVAHPRLGEKKVDSEQSRREQAQLNQGGGAGEAERLAELNRAYEQKFPGLRYVYAPPVNRCDVFNLADPP